jgi:ArsR family transcriptional regulator
VTGERASQPPLVSWLHTLGDMGRLRILRLLDHEELSVGEMARALQLPQSTVSRHLKVLLDGRWVARRVERTASYYRLTPQTLPETAAQLWALTRSGLGTGPTFREDDHRLREILAQRSTDSRDFFGRVGGEWDALRQELFGAVSTAESLLHVMDPGWVVADLGCGTGNAVRLVAPLVRQVIAVDREPAMLDAAGRRLAGAENVRFVEGDLLDLPLEDGMVDAALILLVLHHLPEPQLAVVEAARIVRRGGVLLIVDMVSHDRESYRNTMGHVHLGFDEAQIAGWARASGLSLQCCRRLRADPDAKGPGLFVARLEKGSGVFSPLQ